MSHVKRPDSIDRVFALDALRDDAPIEALAGYLRRAAAYLNEPQEEPVGIKPDVRSAQIALVLGSIAEALDRKGKTKWRLRLMQRGRGRPTSPGRRRLRTKEALAAYLYSTSDGKKEAAIEMIKERTGLSRSAIFLAVRRHKKVMEEGKIYRRVLAFVQSGKIGD